MIATDTRLVGAWRLERFEIAFQDSGIREPSMGVHPSGRFIFTADGWASSVITAEDRRARCSCGPLTRLAYAQACVAQRSFQPGR